MLSIGRVQWLMRAATALRSHGEAQLAAEADAWLLSDTDARAAISKANHERAKAGNAGGRPARAYAIEVSPHGKVTFAKGARAAFSIYKAEIEAIERGHFAPSYGSFAVMLSRAGGCHTAIETSDGHVDVVARRCTDYEIERLLESEAGTNPA